MGLTTDELRNSFISQLKFFTDRIRETRTFSQYMDSLIDADRCLENIVNRTTDKELEPIGPQIRELAYEAVTAAISLEYPKDNGATLEGVQMKLYNFLNLVDHKISLGDRTIGIYGNLQKLAAKESQRGAVFTYRIWDKIIVARSRRVVGGKFLTNGMSHN